MEKGILKKGVLARLYFGENAGYDYATRKGSENARIRFSKLIKAGKADQEKLDQAFQKYIENLKNEYKQLMEE